MMPKEAEPTFETPDAHWSNQGRMDAAGVEFTNGDGPATRFTLTTDRYWTRANIAEPRLLK
jgi:hypothetical protein